MTEPTIFMSHSSKDREFTNGLAKRLHEANFHCWIDLDDIPDGSTWPREIEKAITACDAMIVVMSKHGRESEWVERETLVAMDLRKPLFIARIDDTPLPIHLINRQYTDFRARPDAAIKKLIAALQKALSGVPLPEPKPSEQKKLAPEPNTLNFFKYMEQLPDGAENARIARALYDWAKPIFTSLVFTGRKEPAFQANLSVGPGGVSIFSVRAYAKQPAVEVALQYLMNFPPYDDQAKRLELLHTLNRFVSEPFADDRADRRPNIPLLAFSDASAFAAFTDLIAEIVAALS
ncbi:MAG TPA: toll/interleukin-1 receptor domain-containing protein [Phototrophicaceae bacterium]|nr:toll/interleukin-1 receptor domain-containing protein [Phototrophicaceae bacterium]